MAKLFEQDERPAGEGVPAAGRRVVGVAVAANVWRTYDYVWPDGFGAPAVGQRVRVSFGTSKRPQLGFVADTDRRPDRQKLKSIAELIDPEPQLDKGLWRLAEWISRYYLSPPGMTLAAMVPSAVGQRGQRSETVVHLNVDPGDWPANLGSRQKRLLDELLEARKQGVEPLTLEELLKQADVGRQSVRASVQRLRERDLVRMESRPVRLPELAGDAESDPFDLNAEQAAALDALTPRLDAGGFSATLLHGVTGSGKTEVYIRAIRRVLAAGRQAVLLVPEIALATQTLQRLVRRLPRVAVLHSALTDRERAFYYEQIRDGHAGVVVGPRSAVFAPARALGLIIVDEEHEGSYKQDNAPRYNGRDVAVMRGRLADVPVLLGSATPSLESVHNVRRGRYELLRLPHRVRSLPMPSLQVVHLRKEMETGKIELLGATLTARMAGALDRGEQIILLMNRRGYASYVFCPKCKWMYECANCTRPMVYHQASQLCLCHYCQETTSLPDRCCACDGKLLLFGLGIQRIEDELSRKFPHAAVARMDSDTMTSPRQFEKVLADFAAGQRDILLGTQMVAKGLDFPRVSLVGVVSADTSLSIPDFRASERTFQLIVQVAGRAGRADLPGQVVVQTLHADEPAIQCAIRHDYDAFAAHELPLREEAQLPPFTRLVRLLVRHQKVTRAQEAANLLARRLRELLPAGGWQMWGPDPAGVFRIRGAFRFQILLLTDKPNVVQQAIGPHMEAITRDLPAELLADVDPMNLV